MVVVQYEVSFLLIDLVVTFSLFIYSKHVLLVFLCCYHFSVNKDLYKKIHRHEIMCELDYKATSDIDNNPEKHEPNIQL